MQSLSRLVGPAFLVLCLLAIILKALVVLPGPLGYAPVDLGFGAKPVPVEVVVWYGTEKKAWLEEAARRFEATGPSANGRPIKITLVGVGSREIADRVARKDWGNDPRPSVISPASSVWTRVLEADWAARNGGTIIDGDTQPLVLTPLVAVAWQERAAVLWPQGADNFWTSLHDALSDQQGWIGVATRNGFGPDSEQYQKAQNWGFVKFGHTSPLRSNSGAQALILMAYGYHNKTNKLTAADTLDPGFQKWFEEMETAVLDFGESTGTFMTSMVQFGPSKYDVVLVYENLALENIDAAQGRWGQPLQIFYPPATMFSDHPYAILGDALTSPEERAAAARFRDFLLERPQQELALQYGFRPANPNIAVTSDDPNNPFKRYTSAGVQIDIPLQVETPTGDTINTLLELWRRQVGPYAARFEGTP